MKNISNFTEMRKDKVIKQRCMKIKETLHRWRIEELYKYEEWKNFTNMKNISNFTEIRER